MGGGLVVIGVAGVAIGVLVGVAGLVVLWGDRVRRREGLSSPTRLTVGVVAMVVGYHLAAWSLPGGWLSLRVPVERWWLVAGAAAAAVLGALAADRMDATAGERG